MKLIAFLILLALPALTGAHDRKDPPKPEQPPPQSAPGKSSNSRFWGGLAVGAVIAGGIYYVVTRDGEDCKQPTPAAAPPAEPTMPALQPAPPMLQPKAKPKPVAKPPMECKPPTSVTKAGIEAQPDGVVAAVFQHRF